MKKVLFTFILTVLVMLTVSAQAPQSFKYQAVVRDKSGQLLPNQTISLRISILQSTIDGPEVYKEMHAVTTGDLGLVNIEVGRGKSLSGSMDAIDWGAGSHFLRIEMDQTGGTDFELMGVSQLLSVPYALYAEKAGSGERGDDYDWQRNGNNVVTGHGGAYPIGNVGIGNTAPASLLYVAKLSTEPTITVRNMGGIGGASYAMVDDVSGANWKFKVTGSGGFKIRDQRYALDVVTIESPSAANAIYIRMGGNVGIGTINPQYKLDVSADALINGLRVGRGNNSNIYNTAMGREALNSNLSGSMDNTAIGYQVLMDNNTGIRNTAIGAHALTANTSGMRNTAGGDYALSANTTGSYNTAYGNGTLISNTSGSQNTAVGNFALVYNETGNANVAVGAGALFHNPDRSNLVAVGDSALFNNGTGITDPYQATNNTAIGSKSLYTSTTGSGNTTLGKETGYTNSTGSGNVFLGYRAGYNETGSNTLYIENSDSPTPLIYGEFEEDSLRINGNVSIRDVESEEQLYVLGYNTSTGEVTKMDVAGIAIGPGVCIDYDGNAYPTFQIGNQVWMAENLRVTHLCNGDSIPNAVSDWEWETFWIGAYCWYNNDPVNYAKYGALYKWNTMNLPSGLCPEGWRVPTVAELTTLTSYLGGESVAGGKMKSVSVLWVSPNTDATNTSGFSGLPGGSRSYLNLFSGVGHGGNWWTSTEFDLDHGWGYSFDNDYGGMSLFYSNKPNGFSVRCLRDY